MITARSPACLVLNPIWRTTRCLRTAQENYALTTPSLLLRGTNFRFTASSASKRTVQRPTCRWLTTGQRNDVLPLGRVQQRRRPGTSALVQSRFRAPLLIALAREPHRLRRQPDTGGHLANRLAVGQLSKRQSPQYRSYRLQPAAQQPLDLLPLLLGQSNRKSRSLRHVQAVTREMPPAKYLPDYSLRGHGTSATEHRPASAVGQQSPCGQHHSDGIRRRRSSPPLQGPVFHPRH